VVTKTNDKSIFEVKVTSNKTLLSNDVNEEEHGKKWTVNRRVKDCCMNEWLEKSINYCGTDSKWMGE